jgi:hypothetical protein
MKIALPALLLGLTQADPAPVPVSPLLADRYLAGAAGAVEAHLDARNAHRLEGVTLGGRRYASGGNFPRFVVLDGAGKRFEVPAMDPRLDVRAAKDAVHYRARGLEVAVRYAPDRDRLHVVVSVISEGEWKLVSVGGTLLSRAAAGPEDALIDGSGWVVTPDLPKTLNRTWDAQSDQLVGGQTPAGFVAWREPDRLVVLKPLTLSHRLGWTAAPARAGWKPYEDSFDTTERVTPSPGYRARDVKVETSPAALKEGTGSLKLTWSSGPQGYATAAARKDFEPADFTGKTFGVWMRSGTPETCATLGVALYDDKGRRAEVRYAHHLRDWTRLAIPVGSKGAWSRFETQADADLTRISRVEFFGITSGANQAAELLVDAFEDEGSTAGTSATFALQAGLYFRPPETQVPQTRLCHDALALRLETAVDVNRDGRVDWVDAGTAYRERYVKPHRAGCARGRLRDAFRVYYAVYPFRSYQGAFKGLADLDFADGIWWCKGVMAPAVPTDSESHPFTVKPNPVMSDRLADFKDALARAGQFAGIYYGHDYMALDQKDWPDEFIKRNPDQSPDVCLQYPPGHAYVSKYSKDNVRSVATGAVFRHYEEILKACSLRPGDPIMLDTFSAYARPGYHPEYPATAELETRAKHRIAEFLHDKGLIVAGEGLVEGLQDVVDYGAIAIEPEHWVKGPWWEKRGGVRHVPMLPVVFQGSGYYGASWGELRGPRPNWAAGLVFGVGYWDWLAQGPHLAWKRFARYYFNQNLAWAQVADAKVRAVRQAGSRFTVAYDNGVEIESDLQANRWALTKGGVRYDGFTPFSPRGTMAVLAQGPFEITLPGEHRLEVSPNQPFRERIRFECVVEKGQTRIRGQFGDHKWPIPVIVGGAQERVAPYDADPVLVLRKAP